MRAVILTLVMFFPIAAYSGGSGGIGPAGASFQDFLQNLQEMVSEAEHDSSHLVDKYGVYLGGQVYEFPVQLPETAFPAYEVGTQAYIYVIDSSSFPEIASDAVPLQWNSNERLHVIVPVDEAEF